jgi:hypothetical protein
MHRGCCSWILEFSTDVFFEGPAFGYGAQHLDVGHFSDIDTAVLRFLLSLLQAPDHLEMVRGKPQSNHPIHKPTPASWRLLARVIGTR